MFDWKKVYQDKSLREQYCQDRQIDPNYLEEVYELDKQLKTITLTFNRLNYERKHTDNLTAITIKRELSKLKSEKELIQLKYNQKVSCLPNIISDIVTDQQQTIFTYKSPPTQRKAYVTLPPNRGINLIKAAEVSQRAFAYLEGNTATISRGLGQMMIDTHLKHGYCELATPYLLNHDAFSGTGHFPKFYDDLFEIGRDKLWLIPTAEVSIAAYLINTTLKESQLPLKYVALTPCFRREAGAYGLKNSGLLRQHQFDKVELFQITHPNNYRQVLTEMINDISRILQNLELDYRLVLLARNDTGFSSFLTYDFEVWLPSQQRYIEVSSVSCCSDFQAQRLNLKYQDTTKKTKNYPYTFNGSGLAVGRILLALIDKYLPEKVYLPEKLNSYCSHILQYD